MNLNDFLTHRSVMGISIALSLLLFITFSLCISEWHRDWVLVHQPTAALPVISKNTINDWIATIPNHHLFGKAITDLPITNLEMRVTGIVKVEEQSGLVSKAYISVEGQAAKIYQVGDELPNGVKIDSISHDTVILNSDGRFEKLSLPREKLKFKSKPAKEPE